MLRAFSATLLASILFASPVFAAGQNGEDEPSKPATTDSSAVKMPALATTDVGDLWHWFRHHGETAEPDRNEVAQGKRFIVIAPTIGSKPSTGFTGGLNTNMAFFSGDPATTHISSASAGFKISQKQQVLTGARFNIFTHDDRWFVQGDNRFSWTSQNTFGLGADSLPTSGENIKYDFVRLSETAYRHLRRGLFVGAGLTFNSHTDVRPGTTAQAGWDESAYVAYSEAHGFPVAGQQSSGATFGVIYDTRDNAINAQRGWVGSATYRTYFDGFLGGDSTWQQLTLDARTYKRLTHDGRQRLAFWFMSDLVVGGTAPYFDLPATASDGRSARGYGEGRYRGDHLVYGEVEYRGALTPSGLIGFVAFANTTTVDDPADSLRLFESWAPGAGFGFRVMLNKRSRTNLAMDYGWGKQGSRGFYLGIQEAF
ncbi:MAG TPA: BamA/TamA family outer membrane protein [Vicinamibacterales bacterium]|jgi:outer membrane protein assembly factor BamA